MQIERGAAALVVLRGDDAVVEPQILRPRGFQRLGQRIEALGDGGSSCGARPRQPHLVARALEFGETGGEPGERVEHPPEQHVEEADHRKVEHKRHCRERHRVFPHLRDLVLGLAHDLDRADRRAADDHRHVAALDRRRNQRRKPGRRRLPLVAAQRVGAPTR
jgi:hypothetical protein